MTSATATAPNVLGFLDPAFNSTEIPEGTGGSVPPGKYICRLDSLEAKASKKQTSYGLLTEWEIESEACQGRKLFIWMTIPLDKSLTDEMLMNLGFVDLNEIRGALEKQTREDALRSLGFLKKNLAALGVDVQSPSFSLSQFLSTQLQTVLDIRAELDVVASKTKPGETNTYINPLPGSTAAQSGATSSSTPAASSGVHKPGPGEPGWDPFAEE